MIKPWTKVFSFKYHTKDGWVTPTIPTEDFFGYMATTVMVKDHIVRQKITVHFGCKFYQRKWREYFSIFSTRPTLYFAAVHFESPVTIIEPDALRRIAKTIEIPIGPHEVEALENEDRDQLHNLIKLRVLSKIVNDPTRPLDKRHRRHLF